MLSSLAEIGDLSRKTLAAIEQGIVPPPSMRAKTRTAGLKNIGGFVVEDGPTKAELDKEMEARSRRIEKYRQDRASLTALLAERKVIPQATLPARAWERICIESGLVRLAPNERGEVSVSTAGIARFRRPYYSYKRYTDVVVGCGVGLVFLGFAWALGNANRNPVPYDMIWLSLIVEIMGAGIALVGSKLLDRAEKRCNSEHGLEWDCRRFAARDHREIIRDLFPDGAEVPLAISAAKIPIVLPQPPESFVQNLLKLHGLPGIKVAVEPAAISFPQPLDQLLLKEQRRIEAERLAELQRQRARAEPILYVEHGTAVAVIDQFGPFVIEREVVERVMQTHFAP